MHVDYSLYLVTDSTAPILGDRDIVAAVLQALEGGVTVVQYRDKTSETADLIRIGKELHRITQAYGVPLLVNDRVDVAQAISCEGVHLGQDDMDLKTARTLLGADAIIGATASSVEEARRAAAEGATYLGIGTLFSTPTKKDIKSIIGTAGTREILSALAESNQDIPTVCIGGINSTNVQRVLYQTATPKKTLDGVAVVSAIMGSNDPTDAAEKLSKLINTPPPFAEHAKPLDSLSPQLLREQSPRIVKRLGDIKPLCHNMTNLVVQNFAANVALSIGASPIMSNNGDEAKDLANLGGALVINMGTVTPEGLTNYLQALVAYNLTGGPVVFDPVGGGATEQRRTAIKQLLAGGYFDLIKGNESEIKAVLGLGAQEQQRGVDSGSSTLNTREKGELVRTLAKRESCIVLMTGATDIISDGQRTFAVRNGHEYLGNITGSGCTLGTTVAAFLAVHREDKLLAALAGILTFEIAAEHAAKRSDVQGPGTFVPAFLDELYKIKKLCADGQSGWIDSAQVESVDI